MHEIISLSPATFWGLAGTVVIGGRMEEQENERNTAIEEPEVVIHLSESESITFVEMLLNPPEPSNKLRAAVADYFAFFGGELPDPPAWFHELREFRMAEQQGGTNPVAEQLMAVVEARHGGRMDDADREIVRNGIARNLANTEALAAYPLVNGDEPGSVFRAYRGE